MDRRAFLGTLAGLPAWHSAQAQPASRRVHLGVLSFGVPEPFRDAFRHALLEHGYAEGRNVTIEYRWANGHTARLAGLAAELVRQNVDLIVASATPSVQAVMAATRTIPIVMATAGDALGTNLVTNLARPGANVTGLSLALIELAGKTVALLREAVPHVRNIACVVHRDDPLHRRFLGEVESAARHIGLGFRPFSLKGIAELNDAIASVRRDKNTGIIFQPIFAVDPQVRATIVRRTLELGLPSVSGLRRFAESGGLVAYASEFSDLAQRAAVYVDKILKGAKPGDLPVEQPTKFELVINLKTARALGLTIPPSLLQRADQVIE
jgi:putative tryptophan/tyrosine transport system substrate-binding protein